MPSITASFFSLLAIFVPGGVFMIALVPLGMVEHQLFRALGEALIAVNAAAPGTLVAGVLSLKVAIGCTASEVSAAISARLPNRRNHFCDSDLGGVLEDPVGRFAYSMMQEDRLDLYIAWTSRLRVVMGTGVALIVASVMYVTDAVARYAIPGFATASPAISAPAMAGVLFLLGACLLAVAHDRNQLVRRWIDAVTQLQSQMDVDGHHTTTGHKRRRKDSVPEDNPAFAELTVNHET